MKNIKYYIGVVGICLLGTFIQSCTDLTEATYDRINGSTFGSTPEQYAAIIAPAYGKLQDISWSYYDLNCAVATDCALAPTRGSNWYDGGQWQQLAMHNWTSTNPSLGGAWDFPSRGIVTINQILDQLSHITIPAGVNNDQTIAQLRALRALYLYFQIDLFGDVPLVTDYKDHALPVRTPRAQVFDYIVSELLAVENLVPVQNGGDNYGRITKGVVDMLLAKMYLNAVVWKGSAMWNEAITYCDKVMANSYILEPNWKTNFLVHNEVSRENIFVVPFDRNSGSFQLVNETLHYLSTQTFNLNSGPWNGYCGNTDYIEAFNPNDPRKAGSFLWGQQYTSTGDSLYVSRPSQPLDFTIDVPSFTAATEAAGARCCKYEIENGGYDNMNNDFVVFRLADVYLMKAEALLRSGGSQATALSLVNKIRERAFGNSTYDLTTVTLDDILSERAFEFAWEGPRRQDLIRYEVASGQKYWTKAWRFKPASSPNTMLYPVPLAAIKVNSNLTQNPGY